jgi:hypothetical protein
MEGKGGGSSISCCNWGPLPMAVRSNSSSLSEHRTSKLPSESSDRCLILTPTSQMGKQAPGGSEPYLPYCPSQGSEGSARRGLATPPHKLASCLSLGSEWQP